MAPMLAVTFKVASTNLSYGILLLSLYGVGHCSVIVLAGTFTEVVQHYLDWNEKSKGAVVLKKVCGVLVLLGGLYLIYTARRVPQRQCHLHRGTGGFHQSCQPACATRHRLRP
jgi:cytochrome c-type biogenesis protein